MDNIKKNDVIDMHGYVTRNLYNERGELIESHSHENLIVNSGKSRIIRNIFDGTDIRLVGCMIGRDVNSPMNLTNDSGWIPTDPKPTDTKATIVGDGSTNSRQQGFNKIEFLDKGGAVLGYKTGTTNTMASSSWMNVMAIRYYIFTTMFFRIHRM